MMKPTLRIASTGPIVKVLQDALNLAPSVLPALTPDGMFGMKTDAKVREFQGRNNLAKDGAVGPLTWGMLQPLVDEFEKFVKQIVPPQAEAAARQAIVDHALMQYNTFSWMGQVSPANHRIAGKICCDPVTRLRQGGLHISTIFAVAGANPQKCLTISKDAQDMYNGAGAWEPPRPPYTAKERNNVDIVSWCGIFATYVYKIAGLKFSGWPLKYYPFGKPREGDELQVVATPQRGDIGIVDPMGGSNHHFIIVDFDGSTITSVDGNAGTYMEIINKTYSMSEIKNRQGYFLSPIWDRVGVV